jgi:hypothetical protein
MSVERPRAVSVASALFAGAAAVAALAVVATTVSMARLGSARAHWLSVMGSSTDAVRTVEAIEADLRYQLVLAAASVLLFAGLAAGVRRPSRAARVVGLAAAFTVAVAWSCGVAQSTETRVQGQPTDPAEMRAALADLLPAWYGVAASLAAAGMLALLVAAAIALLRSSASDYYRGSSEGGIVALYTHARPPDVDGSTPT